jgi:hypothetical protein
MAIKKNSFFVLFLAVIPFFCYPLQAQSPEATKSKHGQIISNSPGTEKTAAFPTLPQPGKKVPMPDGLLLYVRLR